MDVHRKNSSESSEDLSQRPKQSSTAVQAEQPASGEIDTRPSNNGTYIYN